MIQRRAADKGNTVLLIVGILLVSAGVALKVVVGASDVLVIALVLIGGTMLPGSRIVDLVRAWRKGNGAPPEPTEASGDSTPRTDGEG